jgi:predicted TIM-barrel fold metal-dependent hydrolase
MRIIAIEEHVTTALYEELPARSGRSNTLAERSKRLGHDIASELRNMSNTRIAAMNEAGIDIQVLSLTIPGGQGLDAATAIKITRDANDRMADAAKAHPGRFAAFAALPTPDVAAAVKELERTVATLGFKGAMINGHTNGEFLDDKKFWPIFEAAQSLDVPIYLHPRDPHPSAQFYFAGYPELATAAWGFTLDTVSHFLRLIFAGVFDAYPRLQIILGHMGEGIPFFLDRLEDHTSIAAKRRGLKKGAAQVMRENVYVTTSGNFSTAAFQCTRDVLGLDRIIFSVDWPYESNQIGVDFLNRLPLAPAEKEKLAYGNAARLLKL